MTKDCWIYLGYKNTDGYGKYNQRLAHHLFYEIYFGDIPKGLNVLHQCDTPPCVNPEHLYLGTHSDNMRDMVKKHRHRAQRYGNPDCEHAFANKISREQAIKIRKLSGKLSYRDIGKQLNIRKATVYAIATGRTWKNL